jgi:anti-sigma regulatory factor (Ser/Thr protein kinase)
VIVFEALPLIKANNPSETKLYTVMFDKDLTIGDSLEHYFQNYYMGELPIEIVSAEHPELLFATLQGLDNPALVLLDVDPELETSEALVQQVRSLAPKAKIAFWTLKPLERMIGFMKQTGVSTMLTKNAPFDFKEFAVALENLIEPEKAYGLERYLGEGVELTEFELSSSDDIMKVFATLQKLFQEHQLQQDNEMLTALMEGITNALYHAHKLPSGEAKHKKSSKIENLPKEERVLVRYGNNANQLGISITDKGGSLTAEGILYWMERNFSAQNLLDTSGRGLYLMHCLADRLMINVEPGKRTEIALLTSIQHHVDTTRVKPFYAHVG